jgi:type IV pilus assembly protein PilV
MMPMRRHATGYIMLEVLVTIVILVFGLLGLAGFQLRTSVAEHEAYQRVQALILVQDMTERIYANRNNAATYVQDDIGSSGTEQTNCADFTGKDRDICEWHNTLVGASEVLDSKSVGTLLGGQGCITAGAANEYFVTVAWQGRMPTVAPETTCGQNDYGNEKLRRAVSMRVQIATLSAPLPPPPVLP